MKNSNLDYYIGFSYCLGIGPIRFNALIAALGSVERAYLASENILKGYLGPKTTEQFIRFRSTFKIKEVHDELKSKQITVITREDRRYPERIRTLSDAPICLYVRGNINRIDFENNRFFGIVGTRKPTPYGQQIAEQFSPALTEAGFIVVSGLAYGIDAIAHSAALQAGGQTIAFLGCGVDVVYPPGNRSIYEKIVNGGGLVISEFPPGHTVLPGLFVARNRLISGLSLGVLVAEGAQNSGALITARYAAEQGRDVFAVPAPINSTMSSAPNLLLKEGAKLVTSPKDILEEYGMSLPVKKTLHKLFNLDATESTILSLLQNNFKKPDELIAQSNLSIKDIVTALSMLEVKGLVEKNEEAQYCVKHSAWL